MVFPVPDFFPLAWHLSVIWLSFLLPSSSLIFSLSLCLFLSFYSPPSLPAYMGVSNVPPPTLPHKFISTQNL